MSTEPYLCRLYLVSPGVLALSAFATQLEAALSAGDVAAFQLRLKGASDDEIREAVRVLMPITHAHGVAFILNDRVDLAREMGVDGVHLGQEDMKLAEARVLLGDAVAIGISCHDSGHLAMEAGEGGADYVAFGAYHPTQSKSPEKLAMYGTPKPDLLPWWSTYTTVPSVAIGGLTPENCGELVTQGADFIAAITAVWSAPEGAAAAVKAFNTAIKHGLSARQI
ncbi:MAG: thiamine phosphate synthase [Alphaproteobacteria bacterium]|nr:thiamine phosphate synthase [Alphaproteobacteria bacterium]